MNYHFKLLLILILIFSYNSLAAANHRNNLPIAQQAASAVPAQITAQQEAGRYLQSLYHEPMEIIYQNNQLFFKQPGRKPIALESIGDRKYKFSNSDYDGFSLTFRNRTGHNDENEVVLTQPTGEVIFSRIKERDNGNTIKLSSTEPAIGFYQSSAINGNTPMAARISREADHLILRLPKMSPYLLVARTDGNFGIEHLPDNFQLQLISDKTGQISEIKLQQPNQTITLMRVPRITIATRDNFTLTAPPDWPTEHIAMPLSFAPDLDLSGYEELRFAPGFFKAQSNDHFSYFFFWMIDGQPMIDDQWLQQSLVKYFRGLTDEVGKEDKATYDLNAIQAQINKITEQQYRGVIHTFDPFATKKPLTLNLEISVTKASDGVHTGLLFCASPQPYQAEIWQQLHDIRDSFRFQSDQDPAFK